MILIPLVQCVCRVRARGLLVHDDHVAGLEGRGVEPLDICAQPENALAADDSLSTCRASVCAAPVVCSFDRSVLAKYLQRYEQPNEKWAPDNQIEVRRQSK